MYLKTDNDHPHIWTWTIARPERANGLGTSLALEFEQQLVSLENKVGQSEGPRCLVITAIPREGRSGKTWIGGGDLKELVPLDKDSGAEYGRQWAGICSRLEQLPLPVLMALDGKTIGGGAEFALAGDIRLGTKVTTFEFRQLRIGLSTGYGGARRLVELIGKAHASRLIWTAPSVTAPEALKLGLLTEVCEDATTLKQRTTALAQELATLGPEAVAAQKRLLHLTRSADPNQLEEEQESFSSIWQNPTHKQILENFNKS
mgnify:FL=1